MKVIIYSVEKETSHSGTKNCYYPKKRTEISSDELKLKEEHLLSLLLISSKYNIGDLLSFFKFFLLKKLYILFLFHVK